MRARSELCSIVAFAVVVLGCARGAEPTGETPATEPPSPLADEIAAHVAAAPFDEPIRLPFPGARGNDAFEYVFTEALPSGGSVTYHRWRGPPERPGPPVTRVDVRSARFAGTGGYTPVYVMGDGDQHVFRRGSPDAPYQANLVFHGSTDAEVDEVLSRTEVTLLPALGTELPEPTDVCVGPIDALRR